MATERKAPDVLIVQINLSGVVEDIQDDPDSPDVAWLTAISNNADSIARVSFPTPTGNPTVGANLQEFRVLVRKMGGTGTPEARIDLYENGVLIREGTLQDITTDTVINFTWNANELGTPDGSIVECLVFGKKSGAGPSARAAIEVGAVEWNVDYTTGGEFIYAGDIPVSVLPGTPKASLSKSYAGDIPLSVLPGYSSTLTMIYAGAVGLVLVPNSAYELMEGGNEYVYAGNIPMTVLPSYDSILERAYKGGISMVILPSYSSILERVYGGDIGLMLVPNSIYRLISGGEKNIYGRFYQFMTLSKP